MGNKYLVAQENVTPTAGNDIMTLVSAASRRIRLVEVAVSGRGASSAAQSVEICRSAAGTTPGGAVTPNKAEHTDQPAATTVVDTTWSVQPAVDTNKHVLGFNALGGANRWTRLQGGNIFEARNGETLSIRCAASTTPQAQSVSVIFEED